MEVWKNMLSTEVRTVKMVLASSQAETGSLKIEWRPFMVHSGEESLYILSRTWKFEINLKRVN